MHQPLAAPRLPPLPAPNPPLNPARRRATEAFAAALARSQVQRLLDLGPDPSTFVPALRECGYRDTVYSGTWTPDELTRSLAGAWTDPRWAVWRNSMTANPAAVTLSPADFLSEAHARRVGGARIHVTLGESHDEKLGPLLEELPELEVVMVEGATRDRVDAAAPWHLDASLTGERGFRRVMLEVHSEEVHEGGEALSLVAVYRREPSPEWQSKKVSRFGKLDVVTSLGGDLRREALDGRDVGREWQARCFAGFFATGERVLSVSEVQPPTPAFAWHRTPSRPSIAEMISAIANEGRAALLVNGDVALLSSVHEVVAELDVDVFHYANRIEVEFESESLTSAHATTVFEHGFDVFLVPHALARIITEGAEMPSEFRVGEPWWDYALPVVARSLGFPIRRLSALKPVGLHLTHPTRYSDSIWHSNGALFLKLVASLEARRPRRLGWLPAHLAKGRAEHRDDEKFMFYVATATVHYLS